MTDRDTFPLGEVPRLGAPDIPLDRQLGSLHAYLSNFRQLLLRHLNPLAVISDDWGSFKRLVDGAIVETIDISVVEDDGNVKLILQASGGGDLTCRFAGERYTLDCTPPAEVALVEGTDTLPQINYVFITENSGILSLETDTSDWPTDQGYCPVATVVVQSAASLANDGAYKVHAWTDHFNSADENGHLAHLNAKLRSLNATWISGVEPSDLVVSSPDAYISTTAGVIFQLHPHDMPAIDMETPAPVFLVNDPTTPFKRITTFDDITQDASGGGINNKYLNLVLWGVVSEKEPDCKLMINLPTDTYTVEAQAQSDENQNSVYAFPDDFVGTAFLIARYTVLGKDAGAWSQSQKVDLRGLLPSSAAGGGGITNFVTLSPDATARNRIVTAVDNIIALHVGGSAGTLNTQTLFSVGSHLGQSTAFITKGGIVRATGFQDLGGSEATFDAFSDDETLAGSSATSAVSERGVKLYVDRVGTEATRHWNANQAAASAWHASTVLANHGGMVAHFVDEAIDFIQISMKIPEWYADFDGTDYFQVRISWYTDVAYPGAANDDVAWLVGWRVFEPGASTLEVPINPLHIPNLTTQSIQIPSGYAAYEMLQTDLAAPISGAVAGAQIPSSGYEDHIITVGVLRYDNTFSTDTFTGSTYIETAEVISGVRAP